VLTRLLRDRAEVAESGEARLCGRPAGSGLRDDSTDRHHMQLPL